MDKLKHIPLDLVEGHHSDRALQPTRSCNRGGALQKADERENKRTELLLSTQRRFIEASKLCSAALLAYARRQNPQERARFQHPYIVLFDLICEKREQRRGHIHTEATAEPIGYWKHGLGFTFYGSGVEIQFNVYPWYEDLPGIWMSPYAIRDLSDEARDGLSLQEVDLFFAQLASQEEIIRDELSGVYMAREVSPLHFGPFCSKPW